MWGVQGPCSTQIPKHHAFVPSGLGLAACALERASLQHNRYQKKYVSRYWDPLPPMQLGGEPCVLVNYGPSLFYRRILCLFRPRDQAYPSCEPAKPSFSLGVSTVYREQSRDRRIGRIRVRRSALVFQEIISGDTASWACLCKVRLRKTSPSVVRAGNVVGTIGG